jgi:multiple sugar transport system ATP-binding protein
VVEWLGNEQYAYLPYDMPTISSEGMQEIEADLGGETMQPQLVVALDPASEIDDGSTAKIWFDPSRLHVFDVASGENLTVAVPATT